MNAMDYSVCGLVALTREYFATAVDRCVEQHRGRAVDHDDLRALVEPYVVTELMNLRDRLGLDADAIHGTVWIDWIPGPRVVLEARLELDEAAIYVECDKELA